MRYSDDDHYDFIEFSTLPFRLIQILHRNGLKRLSTLNRMSDGEILLLRNVGPGGLACIRTHKT